MSVVSPGSPGPLPYLEFCGIEVANAARTISYLRRGLGNTNQGHWELGTGDICSVLYRLGETSGCDKQTFLSPMVDPAPWYDPTEPGSTSFLGLVMRKIEGYDSTIVRSVTQRFAGLSGGTLSAQYRKPRVFKFRAEMVSSGDQGAEYGLRWLTGVLEATSCDTCSSCQGTIRLACPSDDCSDDTLGEWISYNLALTDGPHEVSPFAPGAPADALGGCRDSVTVEWTMTAENPFLYKPAIICLPETELMDCDETECDDICDFLDGAGEAPCCEVDPPERGVLGAIFELYSATGFGEVVLESRANCGDSVGELSLALSGIPAGSTVVANCSTHTITVTDADGNVTDGQYLILLDPGQTIQWIEVADCDQAACLCVRSIGGSAGDSATVVIATQIREG